MTEDRSDTALIAGLRNRDPDALAGAYDRYAPIVYSVFLRITRDESTAQDLVQELFMRLWTRARDFDPARGSLGVWLLSIARNMAIDHVRSARAKFVARLRPLDNADWTQMASYAAEPVAIIDQAATLNAAFGSLNANQKRVLELAYFEGFSQSEIAERLQEPLGTVKSWMRSAIIRLRTAIKGDVAL